MIAKASIGYSLGAMLSIVMAGDGMRIAKFGDDVCVAGREGRCYAMRAVGTLPGKWRREALIDPIGSWRCVPQRVV